MGQQMQEHGRGGFLRVATIVALVTMATSVHARDFDKAKFGLTFSHQYEKVDDVSIHYVTGGSGKTVVLLHGWPQTWYAWRHVMPLLTKAGYRVIAPDLRGLGDSGRPEQGYDKKTVAHNIASLLDKIGIQKTYLVGHDWGGPVAFALASTRPDLIEKVAFLEVTYFDDSLEKLPLLSRTQWIPFHFSFFQQSGLPELLVAGKERQFLQWWFSTAATPNTFSEADLDEYTRAYSTPGAMKAGFAYYRAIFQDIDDTKVFLKAKMAMPVLALGGEFSYGDYPGVLMQKAATHVQGGSVPGAGHWVPEEQPEKTATQLISFFGAR